MKETDLQLVSRLRKLSPFSMAVMGPMIVNRAFHVNLLLAEAEFPPAQKAAMIRTVSPMFRCSAPLLCRSWHPLHAIDPIWKGHIDPRAAALICPQA